MKSKTMIPWWCALFALLLFPSAVHGALEEIPSKVKNDLLSKFEKDRQGAVKKLAAIGTDEAWQLVIEALGDAKGQVAEEAQVQLSQNACPDKTWQRLFGDAGLQNRDEWVGLRSAEVLARRSGPVPIEPLLVVLSKKRPLLSLAALAAIERLEARGAADWGKSPDKERSKAAKAVASMLGVSTALTGQALATLAELDPAQAATVARRQLQSKEPILRASGLCALERTGQSDLIVLATQLSADPDSGVRSVAARVLEALGTKPALLALVARIETEPREKLLLELLPRLQRMTGFKAGRQVAAWTRYAADLPDDWRAQPEPAAPLAEDDAGESMVQGSGLPTYSDRIVYLFDFSGSIWNPVQDGKTRKQLLDPVFHQTLDALQPRVRFNMGPYTSLVKPWQPAVTDADPKRIKEAHRFIEEIKITGPGDFATAVDWAKTDPEIDTICVLTDGAPTGGRRWNMEWMTQRLVEENRYRPIRFDVVLVDCPKGLARHWRFLAEATGGVVQTLDFKP